MTWWHRHHCSQACSKISKVALFRGSTRAGGWPVADDKPETADDPKIDPKSVQLTLKPLLIDHASIAKAHRTRKSRYNTAKVHVVDVDAQKAKGWEVVKAGKRYCSMRREKPISQYLEDRLWSLCKDMGYPVLNGSLFTVEFTRTDGSAGKKQIDVLAKDDETVVVIECKTREKRGTKYLQKDLHETALLQKPIANAIRDYFGGSFDPKILWIYATENIIWSEEDVKRADAARIRLITENELQYFEAYISHVGTAGRYQFLAEFLQGEEIKGLKGVKVPAVRGKLGKDVFYSFTISARHLLKLAFVNHHALNHPEGRPAYQRMIDKRRLNGIGQFIKSGGYFPTNILINLVEHCIFEPLPKISDDGNWKFGHLVLPSKFKSAWIIDGQHRLFGFSNLPEEYLDQPLFVLAFEKIDTAKEADLFITINNKQKSVPKALLVALQADLQMGSDDAEEALSALASFLIRKVAADATSPLFGRFEVPGVPASAAQVLTVPEVQKGLKRSQLIGRVVRKVRLPGHLSGGTDDKTIDRARRSINGYFRAVEAAAPQRWSAGRSGLILTNPGIRAHLMLFSEVLRYQHGLGKIDPYVATPDELVACATSYCEPLFKWLGAASDEQMSARFARKYGEGGVKEYLFALCDIISVSDPQFGSDEYRAYKERSADERADQAKLDVEDITKLISRVVIESLKKIYGTDELPSGEKKYWELGIADSKIKEDAYKAQQQTKAENRAPREAYLHVIDFEKIIKQKGNWEHFKPIFGIPLKGENPKGKEYHLDWLKDFNEIRRVTAHSSIYRHLKDDDFEYIEWLKGELYERCKAAGFDPES